MVICMQYPLLIVKSDKVQNKLQELYEKNLLLQDEISFSVSKNTNAVKENDGQELYLIILQFCNERQCIERLYIGTCVTYQKGENAALDVVARLQCTSKAPLVIQNFLTHSQLDVKLDLVEKEYANVEYSGKLVQLIEELLIRKNKIKCFNSPKIQYPQRKEEETLHVLAQHNEHCVRRWKEQPPMIERSEFQRDRERIVNSKAFRRLVDKAQIFTSSKGDHYRTRMTHTLEVAQIARSIAYSLGMNTDLTEAIALGHDLGHTPFGHQGERTLADILHKKLFLQSKCDITEQNPYGGFKHNFQSIRVASFLEEKYIDFQGLNLSIQTLEGMLKHTKVQCKDCSSCKLENCDVKCCDPSEFIPLDVKEQLYLQYKCATTIEGQIVGIADEIAQRSHDMDDAFSSELLDFDEFYDFLCMSKLKPLRRKIQNTYENLKKCRTRVQVDEKQMLYARIISDIIWYLVNDVVKMSEYNMKQYVEDDFYTEHHRFKEELICFSQEGSQVCGLLEKLIAKKAVNCPEVTRFDENAERVISELFRRYYKNPKLMHVNTLRRLYVEMADRVDNTLDLVDGEPAQVREEISNITSWKFPESTEVWTDKDREYWEKNKILVRAVTDYIAGMTDNYAMNEYFSFMK